MKVQQLEEKLNEWCPFSYAEKWDPVGLLCGDREIEVTGIIVTIDYSFAVLTKALHHKCNVVIVHHPVYFPKTTPMVALTSDEKNALLFRSVQKGVAVFAMHTNFDRGAAAPMKKLAQDLGVVAQGRLFSELEPFKKLVVFAPRSAADKIKQSIFSAGAGSIGLYDECNFTLEGTGSFRALPGADPAIGHVGMPESVPEVRLESVYPEVLEKEIVAALKNAHPYEEPAYDLVPLAQTFAVAGVKRGLGYGFLGERLTPTPLNNLLTDVAATFAPEYAGALVTGQSAPDKMILRVAYSPGQGGSFIDSVIQNKVEVFITGEVGYHAAKRAAQSGVCVVQLGHVKSEVPFIRAHAEFLTDLGLKPVTVWPHELPSAQTFISIQNN